ncbi:MAG TPA: hypothetical protein VF481_16725 [Novosphingobium sp.]
MSDSELLVLQAPMFDRRPPDPLALFDDGIGPAVASLGKRRIVQARAVVLALDPRLDLVIEVARQDAVFEQDAAFQVPVPALGLAFGLRRPIDESALRQRYFSPLAGPQADQDTT